jgi:hypothetical protein
MFTNSNKAFFYKFQLFLKWKGFDFNNSPLPAGKKENPNRSLNLLSSDEATNFKARK